MARGPLVSAAERMEIRRRIAAGERIREVARALNRSRWTIQAQVRQRSGMPVRLTIRSPLRLTLAEREEISRGIRGGESLRSIAGRLARSASTVSREVSRNGGRERYRAWTADRTAAKRARRPKVARLARNRELRAAVEALLRAHWSPEQIAWELRQDYPGRPEMWVSHETIYQSLFVQGRGALRRELTRWLRTGRTHRRPQGRHYPADQRIHDMVLISERPAEVEDRAVPGHWEGDLILGTRQLSAIGTLVERQTRFVMLVALQEGRSAEQVRVALTRQIRQLPAELRRTLTWDRGHEMSQHVRFSVDTGVAVYFCDPYKPWQRGSNENTNGLLRQYFPKGTDLSGYDQAYLDAVARELNGRPRQTLGWLKPCEALAKLVASTD